MLVEGMVATVGRTSPRSGSKESYEPRDGEIGFAALSRVIEGPEAAEDGGTLRLGPWESRVIVR
ncbi:hypothetical protein ACIHFD_35280 [Nonomuraea sp. NPDC051941]|uniref:hypothetical protein n=1 Tax=Nonomuraea sp. NPDC051941 TaxID=3364373 RepID=UPI0037C98E2E